MNTRTQTFVVEYGQVFHCTDLVEARTADEAWEKVQNGDGRNIHQAPGEIIVDGEDDHDARADTI